MILNWTWHSVVTSIQFIVKYLTLFLPSIDPSSSSSTLTSSFRIWRPFCLVSRISFFLPWCAFLLSQPLLCLPVGVVLFDMAQRMNMAKGSPALTMASKDHRGCARGVTSKAVVCPFLADATGMFSSRGPRFLGFQVFLSQSLMTSSISYDVIIMHTLGRSSS
jgi:hypothetical protein